MNLLTIADGFGDSVAVPPWYPDFIKWPEIIQLMTKGVNLLNLSRYGAGNEYITHCLKNHITDRDLILVQWAKPERLDLVLSHNDVFTNFWNNVIASDSMYHSNIVETALSKFWISSASKTEPVIEYHQKYISSNQHKLRSQIYIDYAKLLLDRCKIKHHFMLTQDSYYLRDNVDSSINWIWHSAWQGMDSFRRVSKYASDRKSTRLNSSHRT